jgi:DNA-binding transcriptional ArsR family regulator
MARAATTLDSFSAIAEPKRRELLEVLQDDEKPVNELVNRLGWPQPVVSKHLGVLSKVGLVEMRKDGKQRFYRVNGEGLKTVHDWAKMFEKLWDKHLLAIKARAEKKASEQRGG